MNHTDSYAELTQKYNVVERFQNLLDELQDIIIKCNLQNAVEVNVNLLKKAVIDYFEDIERLKNFEEIDRANVAKIYAYEAFWLMRRKPIQIIKPELVLQKYWCINEIACAAILISKMYAEMGIEPDTQNSRRNKFFELLCYNFKYRIYTQKTLELMVEAFSFGCHVGK